MSNVPDNRIRVANRQPVNPEGQFVLYWMVANRRATYNYSLQRAVEWAKDLRKPLVVLEAFKCDYPWASDRIHAFVMQGMIDNQREFQKHRVTYFPYLEPQAGEDRGLLAELANKSCVVVSDDFPCFFLPAMMKAAARSITCRFELVDSNGIYPMVGTDRVFSRAHDFRRHLQKELPKYLTESPVADPLKEQTLPQLDCLPTDITSRWQSAVLDAKGLDSTVASLPINHSVVRCDVTGGSTAANSTLKQFVTSKLKDYAELRNQPEQDVSSGLSAYLHFGHLSAHEVFKAIAQSEDWTIDSLAEKASGSASGWWGMQSSAESFLDELITWRELGYNMCSKRTDYDRYESLPDWAKKTLADHENDNREHIYSLEEFQQSQTHDPLWNAAQFQLVREGRIHNYLRMLWGKKILQWTKTPRDALDVMIQLNNQYALDGRNPNSYSGIFWVLGRYDRAWGPERPVFGKIRYMTSENTAKKVKVKNYIQSYSNE